MSNLFNLFTITCDAPRPWGVYFQDSASPQMEALIELHDNIMFYLVIILFGVAWVMLSIVRNYVNSKSPISNKYLNYGTLELIWTITPALILILIALPSLKLLYLMGEFTDPSLTLFVEGHQWYLDYEYLDFLSASDSLSDLEDMPELTYTDDNSVIGDCEHNSLGSFDAETQEDVENTRCDICNNPPFHNVGDRTTICNNCFIILCDDCHVEYSSSDSSSDSSS